MSEVKVGQIWKDKDPRHKILERWVKVLAIHQDRIRIQRCDATGTPLFGAPWRVTGIVRFYKGGRSTGFSLFKDVSP